MSTKHPKSTRRTSKWQAIVSATACLIAATMASADELPRKAKTPPEKYPNVDVRYDSVSTPGGERLRTIITKPQGAKEKLPVIFVVGWLSCDSVEAPAGTKDATGIMFQHLAQLPGFSLFRLDKPGVGDSEGDCSGTDFEKELAGYRAALGALKNYDFIDSEKVYLLGISNGGGFAPLVPQSEAEKAQVRGYIVVGGWVKTWFEHMLEIERRRFALMGKSPTEVNKQMKGAATLYHEWLLEKQPLAEVLRAQPALRDLWPGGKDHAHLYGRPLAFYAQLQALNLAEAWASVKVPTLVLHGQYDWIMSRDDHELIAQYVNANQPNAARFVDVPEMGHTFQHYLSLPDAFNDKAEEFDPKVARLITGWLREQQSKN